MRVQLHAQACMRACACAACRLSPLYPDTLMVGMELRDKVSAYVRERIGERRVRHAGMRAWPPAPATPCMWALSWPHAQRAHARHAPCTPSRRGPAAPSGCACNLPAALYRAPRTAHRACPRQPTQGAAQEARSAARALCCKLGAHAHTAGSSAMTHHSSRQSCLPPTHDS